MKSTVRAAVILAAVVAVVAGAVGYSILSRGLSTRTPKSPARFRQEEEMRRFLGGDTGAAPTSTTPPKIHHE